MPVGLSVLELRLLVSPRMASGAWSARSLAAASSMPGMIEMSRFRANVVSYAGLMIIRQFDGCEVT